MPGSLCPVSSYERLACRGSLLMLHGADVHTSHHAQGLQCNCVNFWD